MDSEDDLIIAIGPISCWHVCIFVLLSLVCIPVSWQFSIYFFQAPTNIPFALNDSSDSTFIFNTNNSDADQCDICKWKYEAVVKNGTGQISDSNYIEQCENNITWIFDHTKYSWSITEEFQLVCHLSYVHTLIKALYMLGICIGVVGGGFLSDRYGRKFAMKHSMWLLTVFTLATVVSQSLTALIILKFISSVFVLLIYTTAFVYAMEIVGSKYRYILGLLFQLPFSFGYISIGFVSIYLTNWRYLQIVLGFIQVPFIFIFWFMPESIRWLLINNRLSDAKIIAAQISRFNSVSIALDGVKIQQNDSDSARLNVCHLCSSLQLARRTANSWFCWFSVTLVYYALLLTYVELGDDIHNNMIIGGLVEIPAYSLSIVLCRYGGKKLPISCLLILTALTLSCLALAPEGEQFMIQKILVAIIRFTITASFGILYVFTAETFPTVLRSTAVSSASFFGRIASFISPFFIYLAYISTSAPAWVMAVLASISGLCILFVPETSELKLPDTLEDFKIASF